MQLKTSWEIQPIPWKLFLDDERFPADDDREWKIARSVGQAKAMIEENGLPYYMTLDHDLGEDLTGYDFVKWFVEHLMNYELEWTGTFYVHSQNPIGKQNMESYLDSYLRTRYI